MRDLLRQFQYPALILTFALGLGAGIFVDQWTAAAPDSDITREGGYAYINPLLSCDISEDTPDPEYRAVASTIKQVIDEEVAAGAASRVSVYLRDMNSGRWTGVNADGLYAPASLLKVPLYIAYLKASQENPRILESPVLLAPGDENALMLIQPKNPLIAGRAYSVADVLHAMIVDSDNNAANALAKRAPDDELANVYGDFGLPIVEDEDTNIMSPKVYMRLFRILYNSSYLERERSQQALELMSHTTFTDGLVAGLPQGVHVSHKYGEREIYVGGERTASLVQLHDCGIVYYPHAPYGVCVMTEGANLQDLALTIARISKTLYAEVEKGSLTR